MVGIVLVRAGLGQVRLEVIGGHLKGEGYPLSMGRGESACCRGDTSSLFSGHGRSKERTPALRKGASQNVI